MALQDPSDWWYSRIKNQVYLLGITKALTQNHESLYEGFLFSINKKIYVAKAQGTSGEKRR